MLVRLIVSNTYDVCVQELTEFAVVRYGNENVCRKTCCHHQKKNLNETQIDC